MTCRIERNQDGSIKRVLDKNGQESTLYNDILSIVKRDLQKIPANLIAAAKSEEAEDIALLLFAQTETQEFKDWYNSTSSFVVNTSPKLQQVEELFVSTPELANTIYEVLGFNESLTPQQKQQAQQLYAQYLDTIFPDSKVKDIVWHQSKALQKFDNFDDSFSRENGDFGKAFYFSSLEKLNKVWNSKALNDITFKLAALLNIQNPLTIPNSSYTIDSPTQSLQNGEYDSIIDYYDDKAANYQGESYLQIAIKSPKNIHILGSEKDIQGFKEFADNNKTRYQRLNSNIKAAPDIKLRNLASRLTATTGIEHVFINDPSQEFKGKVENNKAVINLAYATLDTPTHEILGHSYVRYLRTSNDSLYNELVQELENSIEGKQLLEELKDKYAASELQEEAVVELLSRLLTNKIVKTPLLETLINKFLEFIKSLIGYTKGASELTAFSNVVNFLDTKIQEAVKNHDNYLRQIVETVFNIDLGEQIAQPVQQSMAEELPRPQVNVFNVFKKKYGETVAKLLRGVPFAYDNHEKFIEFLDDLIPIKQHIKHILETNSHAVSQMFSLLFDRTSETNQRVDSPENLLQGSDYEFTQVTDLATLMSFKKYYNAGDVICTYTHPEDRLSKTKMFILIRPYADLIVPVWEVTQEYLKEDHKGAELWKEYLKGRLREDGTYDLNRLDTQREDPYGTSIMNIQFNDEDFQKVLNRYNHAKNPKTGSQLAAPDFTYDGDLNNLIVGLNDAIADFAGVDLGKNRNINIVGNVIKYNNKLYAYDFEREGIYFSDQGYINSLAGHVEIFNTNNVKRIGPGAYVDHKEKMLYMPGNRNFAVIINKDEITNSDKSEIIALKNGKVEELIYNTDEIFEELDNDMLNPKRIIIQKTKNNRLAGFEVNPRLEYIYGPTIDFISRSFNINFDKEDLEIDFPNVETTWKSFFGVVAAKINLPRLGKLEGQFSDMRRGILNIPNVKEIERAVYRNFWFITEEDYTKFTVNSNELYQTLLDIADDKIFNLKKRIADPSSTEEDRLLNIEGLERLNEYLARTRSVFNNPNVYKIINDQFVSYKNEVRPLFIGQETKPIQYRTEENPVTTQIGLEDKQIQKVDLPIDISLVKPMLEELQAAGKEALVVGGSVRDALFGNSPKDIDIEVYNTSLEELESILRKYGQVNAVGKSFGVLKFAPYDSKAKIIENEVPAKGLIMPIGISGSGKSTWIKTLPEGTVVISPDDIRRELTGSVSNQSRNAEVFFIAVLRAQQALSQDKLVVFDATNTNTFFRNKTISDIFGTDSYDLYYKVLASDPDVSKQRIKAQLEAGEDRAATPDEIIDKQFTDYQYSMEFINNALQLEEPFDFAIPRRENKVGIGYTGFEVEFSTEITKEEAASRRDFTWNSMGYNPLTSELYDYYGGIKDLREGVIRHTSEKFAEDPLRILRAMQFQARMGHKIAPETYNLMQSIISKGEFDALSKERIREEWLKWVIKGKYHSMIFDFMRKSGLGEKYYPELLKLRDTKQDAVFHPEGNVEEHTMQVVAKAAEIAKRENLNENERIILMMSALFHDIAKPQTTEEEYSEKLGRTKITAKGHEAAGEPIAVKILTDIGLKKEQIEIVGALIREHLAHATISSIEDEKGKMSAFTKLINRLKPATVEQLMLLMEADMLGRNNSASPIPPSILEFNRLLNEYKEKNAGKLEFTPILQGRHLIAKGLKPGKEFGELLKVAKEAQLNLEFTNEDEALEWLQTYLASNSKANDFQMLNEAKGLRKRSLSQEDKEKQAVLFDSFGVSQDAAGEVVLSSIAIRQGKLGSLAHRLLGKNLQTRVTMRRLPANDRMFYDAERDEIVINSDYLFSAEELEYLLMHEIIHAFTAKGSSEFIASMTKAMNSFMNEGQYGFENVYEFIAEIMTNPEFVSSLKKKNIFARIIEAIRKLLGLSSATDSIIDEILTYIEKGERVENVLPFRLNAPPPAITVAKAHELIDVFKLQIAERQRLLSSRTSDRLSYSYVAGTKKLKALSDAMAASELAKSIGKYIEDAESNFVSMQRKMDEIVDKETLSKQDIHQLVEIYELAHTYDNAIENALELFDDSDIRPYIEEESFVRDLDALIGAKERIKRTFIRTAKPAIANALAAAHDGMPEETAKRLADLRAIVPDSDIERLQIDAEIAELEKTVRPTAEAIQRTLDQAEKDVSFMEYLFTPLTASSDISLASFARFVKNGLEEPKSKMQATVARVIPIIRKVGTKFNASKMYEKLQKEATEYLTIYDEDTEKYKIIERKVLKFIRPYNFNEYEKAKKEAYEKHNEEKDNPVMGSNGPLNPKRHIAEFYKNYSKPKPALDIEKMLANYAKMHEEGVIDTDEYFEYLIDNIDFPDSGDILYQYHTKENPMEVIEAMLREFKAARYNYAIKDFAEPEGLPDLDYDELLKPENADLKELYDVLYEIYEEANKMIPAFRQLGDKVPFARKSTIDIATEDGLFAAVRDTFTTTFTETADQVDQYGVQETDTKRSKAIPVDHTYYLPIESVSRDLATSVLRFYGSALKYKSLSSMRPEMDAMIALVGKRKTNVETKDRIANKLGINRNNYMVKNSNAINMLDAFVDNVFFGENRKREKVGNVRLDKVIDSIMRFAAITQLGGFNILLNVTNYLNARANIQLEAFAGQYFNQRQLRYGRNVINRYLATDFWEDFNSGAAISLTGQIIDKYEPIQGMFADKFGRQVSASSAKKLMQSDIWFMGQTAPEFALQTETLFALLEAEEITRPDGTIIKMSQVYKLDENKQLIVDADIAEEVARRENVLRNRLHGINNELHGVYNSFDRPAIQQYALGRLLIMYRKFIPAGVRRRFKKLSYSSQKEGLSEGFYRTFFRLAMKQHKELLKFITRQDSTLTPLERANATRALMELTFLITLGILALLMNSLDWDDEEANMAQNYSMYLTLRLLRELSFYINPKSALEIVSTPTVAYSVVKRFYKLGAQMFEPLETYDRDEGIWEKGDNKLVARFLQLLGVNGYSTEPAYAISILKRVGI